MIYKICRAKINMNNGNRIESRTAYSRRPRSELRDVFLTRFSVMVFVCCRGRKRDSASDSSARAMPSFLNQTENDFFGPSTSSRDLSD